MVALQRQNLPKRPFSQNFRGAFGDTSNFGLFFTFIAFQATYFTKFSENGSITDTLKSKNGSWSPYPFGGHPSPNRAFCSLPLSQPKMERHKDTREAMIVSIKSFFEFWASAMILLFDFRPLQLQNLRKFTLTHFFCLSGKTM